MMNGLTPGKLGISNLVKKSLWVKRRNVKEFSKFFKEIFVNKIQQSCQKYDYRYLKNFVVIKMLLVYTVSKLDIHFFCKNQGHLAPAQVFFHMFSLRLFLFSCILNIFHLFRSTSVTNIFIKYVSKNINNRPISILIFVPRNIYTKIPNKMKTRLVMSNFQFAAWQCIILFVYLHYLQN